MRTVIAADIGGTNARFALFREGEMVFRWSCPSREHGDFMPVLHSFLKEAALSSAEGAVVCLAVAGVIQDDRLATGTNIPWRVDCEEITAETGCHRCIVMNDFEAAAWAVTQLPDERCIRLGKPAPAHGMTKAVLGAGTGLGQAIMPCTPDGDYTVIRSEGGHCGFAPETPEETGLLIWLMARYGHVSVERLLSGHGLVNIWSYLKGEDAGALPDGVENDRMAPEITRKALAGEDTLCIQAVELFCRIYGAEAGNLALKCLPYGGVYVAGGIAPVILPFLQRGIFREAFENKGCMREILQEMPLLVVMEPDLGLKGAAVRAGALYSIA